MSSCMSPRFFSKCHSCLFFYVAQYSLMACPLSNLMHIIVGASWNILKLSCIVIQWNSLNKQKRLNKCDGVFISWLSLRYRRQIREAIILFLSRPLVILAGLSSYPFLHISNIFCFGIGTLPTAPYPSKRSCFLPSEMYLDFVV